MSTLIIPCAGLSTRFPTNKPKYLLTHPDGRLMLEKAYEGFNFSYDRLIIPILEQHCKKFDAYDIVSEAFPTSEILILKEQTSCQAETIYQTIIKKSVDGYFISKDCDNLISVDLPAEPTNLVVGVDLRNRLDISSVASKSFIIVNEQNIVIDILEKEVCSNYISAGVYGFKNSQDFMDGYEAIYDTAGEIYPSHVISFLLSQGDTFNIYYSTRFDDYGDMISWRGEREKHTTYFIDVDGVIFKNSGKYGNHTWYDYSIPLTKNIEVIKTLSRCGAQIIITTARPKSQDGLLAHELKKNKIPYDYIVSGCNHSKRVIINDFAESNPYPSCEAINIPRDSDNLVEFL